MNNNTALCYPNGCFHYCNHPFKTKHEGCTTQTPLSFNSAMIVKMNQLLQNGDQPTGVCLPAGMYVSRHCWTQIVIKSHNWSDYSYLNPCLSAVPVLFVLNWCVASTSTGVNSRHVFVLWVCGGGKQPFTAKIRSSGMLIKCLIW